VQVLRRQLVRQLGPLAFDHDSHFIRDVVDVSDRIRWGGFFVLSLRNHPHAIASASILRIDQELNDCAFLHHVVAPRCSCPAGSRGMAFIPTRVRMRCGGEEIAALALPLLADGDQPPSCLQAQTPVTLRQKRVTQRLIPAAQDRLVRT
jgi:hypothetical protein